MSAYTNTKKIFKVNSKANGEFKCLHAIRVLSLGKQIEIFQIYFLLINILIVTEIDLN